MSTRAASEPIHIRLTPDQRDRAKKCARYMGWTMTTLAQNALIKEIDAIEARIKREAEDRKPRGLGLEDGPVAPRSKQRAAGKPVREDDLERFVLYIAAAESEKEAQRRAERVLEIVAAGASDSEVDAVAKKLDDRVKEMVEARQKDPQYGTVIPGLGDAT